MTMATLIKEGKKAFNWDWLTVNRGLVNFHGWKHGTGHAVMVLEKEQRVSSIQTHVSVGASPTLPSTLSRWAGFF